MGRAILFIVLLAVGSQAGPIGNNLETDTCATTCTASNKFQYAEGKTYDFQYDAKVKTNVNGATEDHAGISLSSTVHVEFLSKCDIVMRLSDVALTEYDPVDGVMKAAPSGFREELEKNPLRVSFQDGNVEELCLSEKEPSWVTNVKRGILSTFQTSMGDFARNQTVTEVDVNGECETEYSAGEKGWYTTTIKKTKNLLGCTGRNGYSSSVQGIPYTAQSDIQSLPLIRSNHQCQHSIDHKVGRLQQVTCTETHVFRPFSRDNSGAMTSNTQTLTFLNERAGVSKPGRVLHRVPLKFEHAYDAGKAVRGRKETEQRLIAVCEGTKDGVTFDTPRLFTDLVFTMRTTESEDLVQIYQSIKQGALCPENQERVKKFFLDAIPMAGSSSTMHLMSQLLLSGEVTGPEASMWLTSLTFTKHPTREMLTEIKPLLSVASLEEKVLMAAGSLVHSYCRVHGQCETDTAVRDIISILGSKIGTDCRVNKANLNTVLLSLRAIGNAGFAHNIIGALNNCMNNKNPIEIRLSAIDAFRRMSCQSDKREIMRTFRDTEEDSEIRIAAYRSLMECPSAELLSTIKSTLEGEEVNQVGSFVWTHLTNLMETSDPHKQEIRSILEDQELLKEFDLDKMKFSRNFEKSLFLEQLNVGAKFEADMIWSSKSFIQRSGMLNMTVDLFGHSVNLFELGGRAEGLEYFLESVFGPNGYFSEDTAATSSEKALSKLTKLGKINKRYGKTMDELRGSLYMRVFGNEMSYMHFEGLESLMSGQSFNPLEMLIKLSKQNDYSFSQSYMFLDSSIIIPTSSGFPLNLTVNGTVTVDFKASGKMDLRSPNNVDIDGMIKPSAAVQLSSMMSVDAYVTKCGIKMVSAMHSSTALQGRVRINEAGIVSAEYDMPNPKMDIISVKSSFFTVHRDMEKEQRMITDNRQVKSICTPAKLVTITGLELCGELEYPNASRIADSPYFPMTGPVSAGIVLYKRDTHMKYKFLARSIHNNMKNVLHMSFITPGSQTDRHFEADFSLAKKAQTIDIALISPWKSADFQGTLTRERDVSAVSGKMKIDGESKFLVNAQVLRSKTGNTFSYTPSFELSIPNREPMNIRAVISNKLNRQIDIQFTCSGLTVTPVTGRTTFYNKPLLQGVEGSITLNEQSPYSFDVRLSKQVKKKAVNFKPLVSIRTPEAEVLAFGGSVDYARGSQLNVNLVLDKIVETKIALKGSLVKKAMKKRRSLYKTRMNFASGPVDVSWDISFDNKNWRTLSTDVDFTYNIRRVSRNNFKIKSRVSNLSSSTLRKGKSSLTLEVKQNPELNLMVTGSGSHHFKHTEAKLEVRYGNNFKDKSRILEVSTSTNHDFKSITSATADIDARILHAGQGIALVMKGDHRHSPKELDSSMTLRYGKKTVETSIQLQDKTQDLVRMSGEFTLNYPGRSVNISHTIDQPSDQELVIVSNVELQKGKLNSMVSRWRSTGAEGIAVVSNINVYQWEPVTLEGEWDLTPANFVAKSSIQKGPRRYAGAVTSVTDDNKSTQMTAEVAYPSRKLVLDVRGSQSGSTYTTDSTLKWNADQDETARMSVATNLFFQDVEHINGSLTVSYPSRTLQLNLNHKKASKYLSHLDFQWEANKKISVDTVLGFNMKQTSQAVTAQAEIITPFQTLRKLVLDFDQNVNNEEYQTDIGAAWNRDRFITGTVVLKKPISLQSLVAVVSAKTSFKTIRKMGFELDHKLSKALSTSGKLTWNRQSVQAEIRLANNSRNQNTNLKGDIDIKTTLQGFKKINLALSHENDGHVYATSAKLRRNKRAYDLLSKGTYRRNGFMIRSSGDVRLIVPQQTLATTWNHTQTLSDLSSGLLMSWGKRQINLKINGHQTFSNGQGSLSTTVELRTPFYSVRDLSFQLNHKHRPAAVASTLLIAHNSQTVSKVQALYKDDQVSERTAESLVVINPLSITAILKGTASYDTFPVTRHVEAEFNSVRSSLDFTGDWAAPGIRNTELVLHTPLEEFKTMKFSESVTLNSNGGELLAGMQINQGSPITLQYRATTRPSKSIYLAVNTPFDVLKRIETSLIVANGQEMRADAFIEVLPYMERMTATVSHSNVDDVFAANIRVETPFKSVPYCQASAKSMLVGAGLRKSFAILEYLPRQEIRLDSAYAGHARDFNIALSLSTPFDVMPLSSFSLVHKVNSSLLSTHADCEYLPGKKISTDVTFSNTDSTKGSITFSSPFLDDITGSFSHAGNLNEFVWHSEISNGRPNQFITHLTYRDGVSLATSGSVTLERLSRGATISFNHDGTLRQFTSNFGWSPTMEPKSEIDIFFDRSRDLEGRISIRSPRMNTAEFSFKHQYHRTQSSMFMESQSTLAINAETTYKVLTTLRKQSSFVGEITLINPYTEEIRMSARLDGEPQNFDFYSELDLGGKRSNIESTYKSSYRQQEFITTLRLHDYSDIVGSISRSGGLDIYNGNAYLTIGEAKHVLDTMFRTSPDIAGKLTINSPKLSDFGVAFNHIGENLNFKTSASVTIGDRQGNVKASLDTTDGITSHVEITAPVIDTVAAEFEYHGQIPDANAHAALSYSDEKRFSVDMSLSAKEKLVGEMSVMTPFMNFESARGLVSHEGDIQNFRSHMEMTIGSAKTEADVSYSMQDRYEGMVTVKSSSFPDMSVQFEHSGEASNFRSHAEGQVGTKRAVGDATFILGKQHVQGTLHLLSPLMEETYVKVSHRGSLSDFACAGEVTHGLNIHKTDIAFSKNDMVLGKFDMTSDVLEPIHASLEHKGGLRDFRSHATWTHGQDVHDATVQVQVIGGIDCSFILRSPLIENLDIVIKSNGKLPDFSSHGHISYGTKRTESDASLSIGQTVEGRFEFSSLDVVSIQLSHSGRMNDFTSGFVVKSDIDETFTGTLVFNAQKVINVDLSVTTPIAGYETSQIIYKHEPLNPVGIKCHAEMLFAKERSEADLSFSTDKTSRAQGLFGIKSAYAPYLSTDFNVKAPQPGEISGHMQMIYDGEKMFGLEAGIDMVDKVKITMDLLTPFENYTSMSGKFIHTGEAPSHFQTTVQLQRELTNIFNADATVTSTNKLRGDVTITSNYMQAIVGKVVHEGNIMAFTSEGEMSYGSDKVSANVQFNLSLDPVVTAGSISVQTPCINELGGSFKFDGKPMNFKTYAEGRIEENKGSTSIGFNFESDLLLTFDFLLPNVAPIRVSVSNDQLFKQVKTQAQLQFSEYTFQMTSLVTWRRSLDVAVTVKTPWTDLEEPRFVFSKNGDFPNIMISTELINNRKNMKLAGSLRHDVSTDGELTLSSPFEGYENMGISFYRKGNLNDFHAGGKVTYGGEDTEASIEHRFATPLIQTYVRLMSPLTDEILFNLTHTFNQLGFTSVSSLISTGYSVTQTVNWRSEPSDIDFQITRTETIGSTTSEQRATLRHNFGLDSFKTDALLAIDDKTIAFEAGLQLQPSVEGTVSLHTPFTGFQDLKMAVSHRGSSRQFLTTGKLQLSPTRVFEGKLDVISSYWRNMAINVEVKTPMEGYEFSRATVKQTVDSNTFVNIASVGIPNREISSVLRTSKRPINLEWIIKTPFEGFNVIQLKGNAASTRNGRYLSHAEASLNNRAIILDGTFLNRARPTLLMNGRISLKTPFNVVRSFAIESSHQRVYGKFIEKIEMTLNGRNILDAEFDHALMASQKTASLIVKSPRPMHFEIDGEVSGLHGEAELVANWNSQNSESNMRFEAAFDRRTESTASFKFIRPHQIVAFNGQLNTVPRLQSNAELSWGGASSQKIGYDVLLDSSDVRAKLVLPSRSYQASGSSRYRTTEGSFMWDADVDSSKKVGFKAVVIPSGDRLRADLTITMPSISKTVQVGSEMMVNRGRVIFDGTTELSYSADARKKITISSRLEDASRGDELSYNFGVGLSHPYSTVGIKINSNLGRSNDKYACGFGLEYLTAKKESKTFSVNGEINQLRKTATFELESPVKTIKIAGHADTHDQFRVTLLNEYDNNQPITTMLTVDPAGRSIDFHINYDLDNPTSELHLTARYVNLSAVAAELYHVVGQEKTSDVFLAARLNTSQLLHTRLHWNTKMAAEFQAYRQRKALEYRQKVAASWARDGRALLEELFTKVYLIRRALEEEIPRGQLAEIDAFGERIAEEVEKFYLESNGTVLAAALVPNPVEVTRIANDIEAYSDGFDVMRKVREPMKRKLTQLFELIRLPAKHLPSRIPGVLNSSVFHLLPATLKQQLDNANKWWDVEEHMTGAVRTVLVWLEQAVEEELLVLKENLVDRIDSPVTVWDPAHGEIQADFPIPYPGLKSLAELPVIESPRLFRLARVFRAVEIPTLPSMPSIPELPPTKGTAYIIGFEAVRTFDGRAYDLPDTFQSVLLARDFVDGNFTMYLVKNQQPLLRIVVNELPITLLSDGQVKIFGKPVETPFNKRGVTISKSEGVVSVANGNNFNVTFNYQSEPSEIQVTVNGWYFGKTGGALGTFDNEPYNDFTSSFNKIIDDTPRFVKSWAV